MFTLLPPLEQVLFVRPSEPWVILLSQCVQKCVGGARNWRDRSANAHIWKEKWEKDGILELFQLRVAERATIRVRRDKFYVE